MKKHFLLLIALFAASMFVMAEMTIYVYKKDGTKVPYVAAEVDSVGFTDVHLITFESNNGSGAVDVVKCVNGESILIPKNKFHSINSTFIGWNTLSDGTGSIYSEGSTLTPIKDMKLYAQWKKNPTEGTENGYTYVDLGLPSGTLWSTTNLGANSPEESGIYYTWDEYSDYDSYNNKCRCSMYSFDTDHRIVLELTDDRAYQTWGEKWRTPTQREINELMTNCTWEWTSVNNVYGYKINSVINNNSIFLPVTGAYFAGDYSVTMKGYGYYWSSSINLSEEPFTLFLESDDISLKNGFKRCNRFCIRPVINRELLSEIFDSNGGIGSMDKINANQGDYISLPKNVYTREGYKFVCWNTERDGSGIFYEDEDMISIYDGLKLYAQWCKLPEEDDYVDLGLPSGAKWAKMNIGAANPENYGFYFAWGEISPSKYAIYNDFFTKNPGVLPLYNDAAYMIWGKEWRMPTQADFLELINNCTYEFITQNGVEGMRLTSKINSNSIFFPSVGRNGNVIIGGNSYYWTSNIADYPQYAYYVNFHPSGGIKIQNGDRDYCYTIRPIMR